MIILGTETSCDETSAAILEQKNGRIQILSNIVTSSAPLQAKYGGIIPEQAAREQIRSIIPVVDTAISNSKCQISNINSIAITQGPGLIGSLLVGVETAKVLAAIWQKPLIPVNHLIGHFYANWISSTVIPAKVIDSEVAQTRGAGIYTNNKSHGSRVKPGMTKDEVPHFPMVGLLVSGGHTDLVLFTDHNKYKYLGGTRDDAAGECFDKCARILGLSYPGGPEIAAEAAKLKVQSEKSKIKLPRPLIQQNSFDFSFSGLKTAVLREVERLKKAQQFSNLTIQQLSYSVQEAMVDVLVEKTIKAAQKYEIKQIMVAGGVAANQEFVRKLKVKSEELKVKLHIPPPQLCTDNAAMIAAAAFFQKPTKDPFKLQADPNLSLSP